MRCRPASRLAITLVLGIVSGCGSYRIVPPLTESERTELASLRERLAGRRVVVRGPEYRRYEPDADLSGSMILLGVNVSPEPQAGVAEIDGEPIGRCDNGFGVTLLTLGLLPYPLRSSETRCRFVAEDGRESVRTFQPDHTYVVGWLGLPLGLLPGWRANVGFGEAVEQHEVTRQHFALFLGRGLVEGKR